jgi:3-oxoacyl-(acyl-carrier-protein) synthase
VTELAVTGVGVVSPLGIGRSAFVEAIRAGSRATFGEVRPETLDTAEYPLARIAEVLGFDAKKYLGDKGLRSLDRLTTLLIVAARLALHDSRLKKDGAWAAGSPDRVGIVVSNAYGSLEAITELDRVATLEDARYINPSRFPLTVSNTAAGYASIWEELRAVNVSVSDGNCGGLDAVECARVLLAQSRADALIVGGVEAMSEALALAFHRLGALTAGARLGEGSALVAVETPEAARARGADVLATIPGYGTAFLPPEREASLVHATPDAVERAIVDALADAALDARDIDVVISGVCGLQPFDQAELVAIERTLGEDTCVVAPKLALGETLGAGGAMGMLVAIALMSPGKDAPTGDLAVRGVLRAPPRKALVTSLGYYGNASALVMSAPSR